ncbi:MAG: hypothetical protein LQ346_005246 [Caloplaca aetnensis]|nr:MAG: hypothetical protein LQ346_005246 [Caloplaca aetnensis]
MSEQDLVVALLFATHRHLQVNYTAMAALAQRLNYRVGPRTPSSLEHKVRKYTALGKLIVEEVGGPAAAINMGATASSEREIGRLKHEGLLPRDWVPKRKTNVPKLYDPVSEADEATVEGPAPALMNHAGPATLTGTRVPSKRCRNEDSSTTPSTSEAKKPRKTEVIDSKPAATKPVVTEPVVTKPTVMEMVEPKRQVEQQKKQEAFDKDIRAIWSALDKARKLARSTMPDDILDQFAPIERPRHELGMRDKLILPEVIYSILCQKHPTEPFIVPEDAILQIIDECQAMIYNYKQRLVWLDRLQELKQKESRHRLRGKQLELHEEEFEEAASQVNEWTNKCISWEDGRQVTYDQAVIQQCREHADKLAPGSDYYEERKQPNPRATMPFRRYHLPMLFDDAEEEPKAKGKGKGKRKTKAEAEVEDEDEDDGDGDGAEAEAGHDQEAGVEAEKEADQQADSIMRHQFEESSQRAKAAALQASHEVDIEADSTLLQQEPDDNQTVIQPPKQVDSDSVVIDLDTEAQSEAVEYALPVHYKLVRRLSNGQFKGTVVNQPKAVDLEHGATTQQGPDHAENDGSTEEVPAPFDFIDLDSELLDLGDEQVDNDEDPQRPGLGKGMDHDGGYGESGEDEIISEADVMEVEHEE